MITMTIEQIKMYHQMAYDARKFAVEHYDEIANRPHTYRLYGQYEMSGIAPFFPRKHSKMPSPRKYSLKNNRRKNFTIYELDENYHMLREIHMLNYDKQDCVFHYFNYGGLVYACPFYPGENKEYCTYTNAIKFLNGHPVMTIITGYNTTFVECYEFLSEDKVEVSTFVYYPMKKDMWGIKTLIHGLEIIEDAPFESPHSPVLEGHDIEKRCMDYDFAKFIHK